MSRVREQLLVRATRRKRGWRRRAGAAAAAAPPRRRSARFPTATLAGRCWRWTRRPRVTARPAARGARGLGWWRTPRGSGDGGASAGAAVRRRDARGRTAARRKGSAEAEARQWRRAGPSTFTERKAGDRARCEEGGDPALPPGGRGRRRGRFRFLELTSFRAETEEGRAAMASDRVVVRAAVRIEAAARARGEDRQRRGRLAPAAGFDDEHERRVDVHRRGGVREPRENVKAALNDGTVRWDPFNLAKARTRSASRGPSSPAPSSTSPRTRPRSRRRTIRRRLGERRSAKANAERRRDEAAEDDPGDVVRVALAASGAAHVLSIGRPTARPANSGRKESRESISTRRASRRLRHRKRRPPTRRPSTAPRRPGPPRGRAAAEGACVQRREHRWTGRAAEAIAIWPQPQPQHAGEGEPDAAGRGRGTDRRCAQQHAAQQRCAQQQAMDAMQIPPLSNNNAAATTTTAARDGSGSAAAAWRWRIRPPPPAASPGATRAVRRRGCARRHRRLLPRTPPRPRASPRRPPRRRSSL